MRRLRGAGAPFLSMETSGWHQHVGVLTILEPGDRPLGFDQVVERIDSRLAWALVGATRGKGRTRHQGHEPTAGAG